ncbi:MAG TPA: pyridoxamine 5'-phosphate oxidase family protein [Solirubrobacteraceae bacterium]|nr:pyridoxamine 5'-phosphate oxidase family protein [Solirubrobacteraceae bacterium]
MAVVWDDEVDAIIAGDLTGALGYRTPAGGVVVQAVAPIGLRDRSAGTIGFTTSLGFSKKLERIRRDPRVAMAFGAREHGFGGGSQYVLVQGRARVVAEPTQADRDEVLRQATLHLGPPAEGWFWDRWLREYYAVRVPVRIDVVRIVVWPDLRCAGVPHVVGEPLPAEAPGAQRAPKGGTAPRVDIAKAARRIRGNDHVLLGFGGGDGFPVVLPVAVEDAGAAGLRLSVAAPLPPGGRRAGAVAHSYRPKLIGLEARQYTGWLDVGDGRALWAPHTETGYKAPPNKTLLLLLNGALAKRGVKRAGKATA